MLTSDIPVIADRAEAYNPSDVLMSLPTSLRRSVLADMEESQLNSLSEVCHDFVFYNGRRARPFV